MEAMVSDMPVSSLPPLLPSTLEEIRVGDLAVHIATTKDEIDAAQALRYRIFYSEMGGTPSPEMRSSQRDFDIFDKYCDHLLVLDYSKPTIHEQVVGTYRLLRRSAMKELRKFYSDSEFDISTIKAIPGEILELGRSCVDVKYRNRWVMQLLWRGIGAYVMHYDVQLMFGCASFTGTTLKEHEVVLSYLYHYHLAPEPLRITALPDHYTEMNLLSKDAFDAKEAFNNLPVLIKGYLRMGGYVGNGAFIDTHCNTIDVGIVVKIDMVTDKYVQRYAGTQSAE